MYKKKKKKKKKYKLHKGIPASHIIGRRVILFLLL